MQGWRILLIVAVASTHLSVSTIASSVSAAPVKRKPIPSLSKFWGRGQNQKSKSKDDTITDDAEEATKEDTDTTEPSEEKEEGERDDEAGSDETKSITTDDKDKSDEPSPTNKTLHAIYIAPPVQHRHARPMYPYAMPHQQHQSTPSTPRTKPPSILSTILSALFFPRPQPSPYPPIPGMPPTSPPVPIGINPIKLMRLAMMILPFLGLGGHSDSFLPSPSQHYTFERLNDRYRRDGYALRQALDSPPPGVNKHRWKRIFGRRKREAVSNLIMEEDTSSQQQIPSLANGALYNRTVIIVDMKPDSRVGNGMADHLRDTVSFLLEQHRDHVDKQRHHATRMQQPSNLFGLPSKLLPAYFSTSLSAHRTHRGIRPALGELEVVLFLDSPGGTVADYGLAASQLSRLRNEEGITLSVCVDRVAASGGYMMACQATPGHLYAAPFAMLGSIGVIMETVNVNEVLRKYGVKPLVIKAGKSKAPLKSLGEVTSEELQMAQDEANVIHGVFQQWVKQSRPNVVASKEWIDKVCTGSVFLGNEARELGLVDKVLTSDEYVAERIAAGDRVLRLIPYKGQFILNISPLDLLAAEGRAKIRQRISGIRRGLIQSVAPLFRVGAAVSILNHLASLQSGGYSWSA